MPMPSDEGFTMKGLNNAFFVRNVSTFLFVVLVGCNHSQSESNTQARNKSGVSVKPETLKFRFSAAENAIVRTDCKSNQVDPENCKATKALKLTPFFACFVRGNRLEENLLVLKRKTYANISASETSNKQAVLAQLKAEISTLEEQLKVLKEERNKLLQANWHKAKNILAGAGGVELNPLHSAGLPLDAAQGDFKVAEILKYVVRCLP
jgi:hypothetical protein